MKIWIVISIGGGSGATQLLAVKARTKASAERKAKRYDGGGDPEDTIEAFALDSVASTMQGQEVRELFRNG